jgi:hypothetical protein
MTIGPHDAMTDCGACTVLHCSTDRPRAAIRLRAINPVQQSQGGDVDVCQGQVDAPVAEMKLFNGMSRHQRIHFLEETVNRVRREISVVAMQWLAIGASGDAVNYPLVKGRRRALLLTMDLAMEELELLHEEEDAQASR